MKLLRNNFAIIIATIILALLSVAAVAQEEAQQEIIKSEKQNENAASASDSVSDSDSANVATSSTTQQPVSEPPIKLVHVLNPGEREYLSPNLIGLQNIAMLHLPLSMNFVNIIQAHREIVNGVLYSILLNAVDTKDNNTDVICDLKILEKPWLHTEWGDKVRELVQTNCSDPGTETMANRFQRANSINDKYKTSTLFNGGSRKDLNDADMAKLESQIMGMDFGKRAPIPLADTSERHEEAKLEKANEAISTAAPAKSDVAHSDDIQKQEQLTLDDTEGASTTIRPLSDDDKQFLNNLFGPSALNVENVQRTLSLDSQTESKAESSSIVSTTINEQSNSNVAAADKATSADKNVDGSKDNGNNAAANYVQPVDSNQQQTPLQLQLKESRQTSEHIVGSCEEEGDKQQQQLPLQLKLEESRQINEQLAGSYDNQQQQLLLEAQRYQEEEGDTQQQQQLLIESEFDPQQQQEEEPQQFQIDSVPAQSAPLAAIIAAAPSNQQNAQHHSIEKRHDNVLVGGQHEADLKEAEETLENSLNQIATGDGPSYKISKIHSAKYQVVSGKLLKIKADLLDGEGKEQECDIDIWTRAWMKENPTETTIKCANQNAIKKRHRRSTEGVEKKTHKKSTRHHLDKVEHLFSKFQAKFKRNYSTTAERQLRLRIFRQNLKTIEELNRNEMGSAKYGITEFADLTSTEYKLRTGLWQRAENEPSKNMPAEIPETLELPKEFDWREKGAVSEVKNQGMCGSCWAFSVTGNIEGLHAAKTGKLEEYSEQELIDCDTIDSACNGGLPDNAYKAIQDIGGLELESEYPYEGHKEQCRFNKGMSHVRVKGAIDLPKNETAMAQWLITNGPISIGINANAMQFYRGGVSHPYRVLCSHKNLDHGVLIVGYGVSDYPMFKKTLPYWIVKNSWGSKWGEQGYYRVYRGDNTCGVSEMATSAVLDL